MTATATKTKRETWRDWMPADSPEPSDLLTRDQLITRLAEIGVPVDDGTIRFWEYHGITPKPIRRWDADAKAARVYYPHWLLTIVLMLRELQKAGMSLDEIGPFLREYSPTAIAIAESAEGLQRFAEKIREKKPGEFDDPIPNSLEDPSWPAQSVFHFLTNRITNVDQSLQLIAGLYTRIVGTPIGRVEVVLYDSDGKEITVARSIEVDTSDSESQNGVASD